MSSRSHNDTFLSRIFGLNSIYNHVGNQNFYDDSSIDLEANLPPPQASVQLQNNILNSESESDSDSTSASDDDDDDDDDEIDDDILLTNAQSINWNLPGRNTSEANIQQLPLQHQHQQQQQQQQAYPPLQNGPLNGSKIKFNIKQRPVFNNKKLKFNIPPKERALYLWANIINMDEFLNDLYYYYHNRGLNNIVLGKLVDLFILAFILWFSIFLNWGIDYRVLKDWNQDHKIYLKDIIIEDYSSKVPFIVKFLLFGFWSYIILRLVQLYFNYKYKLKEIQNFYLQLINIKNDDELMTISWLKIINKLIALKNYNSLTSSNLNSDLNSKIRLSPHDIANRIMRKENYLVALINKDVLNLTLSLGPFSISTSNLLTKTLEWNLKLCIFNFLFNTNGQVNSKVLKDFNRNQLSAELAKRFKMAAIINLILSPFLVIYFVLLYFFKYFNEYRVNPSSIISLRQFTPYAEWKLREFNELPHFFNKRLKLSYNPSNDYINQFPSNFLLVNAMYLINFVSGAITAILVLGGLFLEDESHSFWSFELTENRSVLFYISVFGTIFAITSSSGTESNSNSSINNYYDPEASIKYVSQFTHYLPKHWKGKLHTQEVKNEFCELFKLRILIILNEILSIILTPFLLWFRISSFSSSIIDFFRDYSIHIDGLGYICYFSMFNFEEKEKNMMVRRKGKARRSDDYIEDEDDDEPNLHYRDDKMIKSYMYFLESYQPDKKTAGKPNENGSRVLPRGAPTKRRPEVIDPTNSLIHEPFNDLDQSEISVDKMGKSGVLGMLNQFYKHDTNKN